MRIVADYLAEGASYRSDRKIIHKAALIKMIKVLSGETDTNGIEEWLEKQGIREADEISVTKVRLLFIRPVHYPKHIFSISSIPQPCLFQESPISWAL